MFIFLVICLTVSIFTLQTYVRSRNVSPAHRFLPLLLGLMALYNFYLIAEYTFGESKDIVVLKDLLMVQVLYLVLHYVYDLLKSRMPIVGEVIGFVTLIASDIYIYTQYDKSSHYTMILIGIVLVYILVIIGVSTYRFVVLSFTNNEYNTYGWLYLGLIITSICMIIEKVDNRYNNIILPAILVLDCFVISYLLVMEKLDEPTSSLQKDLYHSADIAMILFDEYFTYLDANERAWEQFKYELEMMEKSRREYRFKYAVEKLALSDEEDEELQYSGQFYRCQVRKANINSRRTGYICTLINVTAQKQETLHMEELKQRAETETLMKSAFLASMSHDLRSPLHAILSGTEILITRSEMSLKSKKMIQQIHKAGEGLLAIVNGILDFSKLEAGKFELKKQVYDFKPIIDEQYHNCFMNLGGKPVNLVFELFSGFPVKMLGDEVRIKGILQNLLSNAAKFTDSGEIKCEIFCEKRGTRIYVRFRVSDTGIGMSKEQLDNIFSEYVTYATYQNQEGTGLGLNITKQIAEMMDGSVLAESDGKSGSVLTVDFYQDIVDDSWHNPYYIKEDIFMDKSQEWQNKVVPSFYYSQAKALVVDDMEVNREILKTLVKPWKFDCDQACDGDEAIEMVRNGNYQIVFIDQMMPKVSGLEAAREIRKFSDIPIVLISANVSDDLQKLCENSNISTYISKPVELLELKNAIEKYINKDYREEVPVDREQYIIEQNTKSDAYYKSIASYHREISEINRNLKDWFEKDLNQFRVKVHGVKGVSRQIGQYEISFAAETLEMAAKLENREFIKYSIDSFREDLDAVLEEIWRELEYHQSSFGNADRTKELVEGDSKEKFGQLKRAFDNYDIDEIEKAISELEKIILTDKEKEIFEEAKNAYEAFEYELGSELLEKV